MLLKLRLLSITLTSGCLLLLVLCIGSQNHINRYKLNLGIASLPPFQNGFLIGLSITLGVVSGGISKTLMIAEKSNEDLGI